MAARPLPPQEYLRECFDYNPETGAFLWKARPREHFSKDQPWKRHNTWLAGWEIKPDNDKATIDVCPLMVSALPGRTDWIWKWMDR